MLELRKVTKHYGRHGSVEALSEVSLHAHTGELIWLAGPSGSGKSTLLGIAGMLVRPSSGRVLLNGRDETDASDARGDSLRSRVIGFVPQAPRLVPQLSAAQNVSLALERSDTREVELALESVGLEDFAHRRARELSGGQQQRVSFARALVKTPALFLADEPSSGLDDTAAEGIFELLATSARNGASVVVASHDERCATFADRKIVVERNGR